MNLAASAGYIAGGLWAWRRRKHRPVPARLAGGLCILGLAGAAAQLLPVDWFVGQRLSIYIVYASALVLLMLTRALANLPTASRRSLVPGLAWSGIIIAFEAGLLWPVDALLPEWAQVIGRPALANFLLAVGWAGLLLSSAWTALRERRRSPRRSILLSYWLIVLLLAAVAEGLFFLDLTAAGGLPRLVVVLLAVYVVTQVRLPAVNHALRRGVVTLLFLLAAVGLYTAFLAALHLLFRSRPQLNPLAASLIASVGLVLLFTGVLQRLYRWTRRAAAGGRRDPALALRPYSQTITGTLDLDRLAALAVETSADFMDARRSCLFLVDIEKDASGAGVYQLHCVKSIGGENPPNGSLLINGSLAVGFKAECRPILQEEIEILPGYAALPDGERDWLEAVGAEAYAPICAKGGWIGLLTVGPKTSGQAYTPRELALLGTLADQTAVALENTRLVEGLLRLNNEFRRAYAALDQANQHLERLDKTKSDFISIASHELRTPLTLINGASQMLLDDPELPENPYHQQLLQKIKAGGDRLHEIVETMLDMAKIDQRTLELEPQPVAPAGLIESVAAEANTAITERRQTIEVDVPRDLPPVTADMIALRKVFLHLVMNAVKYTPDGGKIRIFGRKVEPQSPDLPHGGIEVVVSDTGIGIDPRFHELIFAKFYQTGELALHSTGKTKFKGSGPGLGLAIARGIVAAHHGRIWVESPGYDEERCPGSAFHVILPLRPGDRPAPPPPPPKFILGA